MKKIYVKDLSEYLTKEVSDLFLLKDVVCTSTDGKRWQDLYLMDISGRVVGKCWSEHIKPEYQNYIGMVVRVTGQVEVFREVYGIRLVDVKPVAEGEYDLRDFHLSVSVEDETRLLNRLNELIVSVTDVSYRELLSRVFGPGRIAKFMALPGDNKEHHAYGGGWLRHTIEVAELALQSNRICGGSPVESVEIDQNLIISGALLHDIGKISAYKAYIANYVTSLRGQLVGPVHDGAIFISCTNNSIPKEKRVDDLTQLLHIVVSTHHENAIRPMTKEALIVANADIMSTALAAYDGLFYDFDRRYPENAGKMQINSDYFDSLMTRPGKVEKHYV